MEFGNLKLGYPDSKAWVVSPENRLAIDACSWDSAIHNMNWSLFTASVLFFLVAEASHLNPGLVSGGHAPRPPGLALEVTGS
ncbi:hypothetical protein TRICI_005886 [Trichomonascus ciferrii]|uniref:Uncharacterized protein n=1 Tax=Trichomonascus ciferrii TaxID=44093 RepID=A0A642UNQ9_9ASCO|nr:hypothetical protein TRICI_005886 [Trichomonascus ciferrii]